MSKFFQNRQLRVFVLLLCTSSVSFLWAKNTKKHEQLSIEVQKIDAISSQFNSQAKDKKRVDNLIASFEKFASRNMTAEEKKFMSLEFASVAELPRFEVRNNSIFVYQMSNGRKNILLDIEVVDAQKNLFKYKGKTFELSPNKPLQDNIQFILRELQAGDKAA